MAELCCDAVNMANPATQESMININVLNIIKPLKL